MAAARLVTPSQTRASGRCHIGSDSNNGSDLRHGFTLALSLSSAFYSLTSIFCCSSISSSSSNNEVRAATANKTWPHGIPPAPANASALAIQHPPRSQPPLSSTATVVHFCNLFVSSDNNSDNLCAATADATQRCARWSPLPAAG